MSHVYEIFIYNSMGVSYHRLIIAFQFVEHVNMIQVKSLLIADTFIILGL
jgi:hypothetical protein